MIKEKPKNETNRNHVAKFCPKCGANTTPKYKFCKNCGYPLIAIKHVVSKPKNINSDIPIANPAKGPSKNIDKGISIAIKPKTESSSKALKVPTPNTNNIKSEKSIIIPVEVTKQENTNLNSNSNPKTNLNSNTNSNTNSNPNSNPNLNPNLNSNTNSNSNPNSNPNLNPNLKPNLNPNLNIDKTINKENKENSNSMDKNIREEDKIYFSLADEIHKFYKLKEKGILTSEEFEKKKKQLLEL